MIDLRFNSSSRIIPVPVAIEYLTRGVFVFAFDPGASLTTIRPDVAKSLGYEYEKLPVSGTVFTASGEEPVRKVTLTSVWLQDVQIRHLEAVCMHLPDALKVDGLLGLNFLRHFKVTLDVSDGLLRFETK